ncbi:MAG: ABC transporter substrate-binding protein [Alteromonadaceae bacterium]|nr:ABC transporter substrate-binding protein [Alteromonadaceae bacterium]
MLPLTAGAQEYGSGVRTLPVISSGNSALDEHLIRLIEGRLQGPFMLERMAADTYNPRPDNKLAITIGPSAFADVRKNYPEADILALLVNKRFIEDYREELPGKLGVVYNDVPLLRQALTGQAILPQAQKIALLATTESAGLYDDLMDQLPDFGLQARIFIADTDDQLIPALNRALAYGDFLLAASDNRIYNPRNIKPILLTAYRRNRILIGPSQGYVRAGALASSYVPFVVIAEQASTQLQRYLSEGEFPKTEYPDTFSVEVNEQVARSLNIPLPDRDWISNRVDRLLKENREATE